MDNISDVRRTEKPLPDDIDYIRCYAGGSSSYFSQHRCKYRRSKNRGVLGVPLDEVKVRGTKACGGFSYGQRHFVCADNVPLDLSTAAAIFVPSLMQFTVAPTCDDCIHVMSLMLRPLAAVPAPFVFGRRVRRNKRLRVGIGSLINDHASFQEVLRGSTLQLSPLGQKFAERMELHPEEIFITDFETARRDVPCLPYV